MATSKAGQSYTYATGKDYKTKPKPYQGRSEDPADTVYKIDNVLKEQYSNTIVERGFNGELHVKCFAKDYEYEEVRHPSGSGYQILPDGSRHDRTTGFSSSYSKGSETKTVHGNSDSKTEGQGRTNVKGGEFNTVAGNQSNFVGGSRTEAIAEVGSGHAEYHMGKRTINAEKGIGLGVGQNGKARNYLRIEEDGSINIQVQPQGETGGAATIHIDASGEITITSEKNMNLKCEKFKIEADIELKGNISQEGMISSTGVHDASGHV
jgi:hypothetical protein